jgi:RNA polymerase sigma-70 factor (ECF subfamily)
MSLAAAALPVPVPWLPIPTVRLPARGDNGTREPSVRDTAAASPRIDEDRPTVEAAAAGTPGAFDELVLRYQGRIYNLALGMTRDAGAAEDLAQDTFVRAYRAIGQFRGQSLFRTWLYQIAVNVVRSHLQRQRRQRWSWLPWKADDEDDYTPEETVAADENVELALVQRELIDRALATLPEEMRTAVTLRDVHGLEYREIAAVMDVPIGTVESRIFRARQRLRPLLEPLARRADRTARSPRAVQAALR